MSTVKSSQCVVPYSSVFIDAGWKDFKVAIQSCLTCCQSSENLVERLRSIWTVHSPNHILPCLSVRSGFDLYLSFKKFPPGSEVIMSAINIPSMADIVRHHRLRVVPLDVSIETTAPKLELIDNLVSSRTVAIVVSHLYGKRCPMDSIIAAGKKYGISVIEDCAEGFDAFQTLSHPESDLALFSFGVIKFYTSFGGGIAVMREKSDYEGMLQKHNSYPVQSNKQYLEKVTKYFVLNVMLSGTKFVQYGKQMLRAAGLDYQSRVVKMLRGFPDQTIASIRKQPSTALLTTMVYRQSSAQPTQLLLQRTKGQYVESRLPLELLTVGQCSEINNYWLFPILVDNPDSYVTAMKALGVDVYRGASQLNLVKPDDCSRFLDKETDKVKSSYCYPHEAKYLIDHVVYLPVNKNVPFPVLDHIISMTKVALSIDNSTGLHKIRHVISSKL